MSKLEEKVAKILRDHGEKYVREYTFNDLKSHGHLLRYDFAVFNSKNEIKMLIEVHGEQHMKYTPYFHKTKREFRAAQERDRKKAKYALLHKIPLIVIPYYEIENLTFNDIFSEKFLVTSKYYIDNF